MAQDAAPNSTCNAVSSTVQQEAQHAGALEGALWVFGLAAVMDVHVPHAAEFQAVYHLPN